MTEAATESFVPNPDPYSVPLAEQQGVMMTLIGSQRVPA